MFSSIHSSSIRQFHIFKQETSLSIHDSIHVTNTRRRLRLRDRRAPCRPGACGSGCWRTGSCAPTTSTRATCVGHCKREHKAEVRRVQRLMSYRQSLPLELPVQLALVLMLHKVADLLEGALDQQNHSGDQIPSADWRTRDSPFRLVASRARARSCRRRSRWPRACGTLSRNRPLCEAFKHRLRK